MASPDPDAPAVLRVHANGSCVLEIPDHEGECLDYLLIVSQSQLGRVLRAYAEHYNRARPHRGLRLEVPESADVGRAAGPIQRKDVLGVPCCFMSRAV